MNKELLIQIGKRIHDRRRNLSMTQEQLAEKMDVSVQMISNLERGNKEIKISNLIELSSILDLSIDYLLTGKKITENKSVSEKISLLSKKDAKIVEELVDRLIR